ncbi:MAG TPA: deoxyribonuclease IV, partial [Syntrophobacteria bacterium]|nr:deoxyribonuclease IV [Syntrophobacteria bacterium]
MPLLGAHMSIAGGLHLAFARIREVRGEALQIFLRNERRWHAPPLASEAVASFRHSHEESGNLPVAAHDSYLINLAAPDPVVRDRSIDAFAEELRRGEMLGISYLITHPGSHLGQGVEAGLERFVHGMDRAIAASSTSSIAVLIETTAGQGTNLGSTFEEIAFILGRSRYNHRLGVCLDTCHCFAAGYDFRTPGIYEETICRFHQVIGLERLRYFHLNDSKGDLGSRLDRHEHIGKGKIGLAGFELLLKDTRFREHPMVLETPKGKDLKEDKENLKVLRRLIKSEARTGRGKK